MRRRQFDRGTIETIRRSLAQIYGAATSPSQARWEETFLAMNRREPNRPPVIVSGKH